MEKDESAIPKHPNQRISKQIEDINESAEFRSS